jgi:HlyD family secretion protein
MRTHKNKDHRYEESESMSNEGGELSPSRVDLSQLAVHRDSVRTEHKSHRRSHLATRYILPAALLLGFLSLIGWAARESLLPAQRVTVMPVLRSQAEVRQANEPLFQAAGWVEPRPQAIVVTALAEGVVERVLVVEDQEVIAGEPVAYLIDADAKLSLEGAEAELDLQEADLARAQAKLTTAKSRIEHPVHLEEQLSEAEAALARAQRELNAFPSLLAAAEAHEEYARLNFERKTAAEGALSGRDIEQARNEWDIAITTVQELRSREDQLATEALALSSRRDALGRQLELMIDETGAVAEAEADVRSGEALVRQALNAIETAKLRLERMTIRAPRDGRVLHLNASAGSKVSGFQGSSTIATLYDPEMLQLRTDVPLEQVPIVQVGQPVRIETESVPEGLLGEVLFKTAFTDIQKNTLDVKVAVTNPPADLKPDMLVRVTFLALPNPEGAEEETEFVRTLIPESLIEQDENGSRVWIADQASGTARSRIVTVGQSTTTGELIEIIEGLTETDKLIVAGRDGLRDGQRINITGEDATQGIERAVQREPAMDVRRIMPGNDAS